MDILWKYNLKIYMTNQNLNLLSSHHQLNFSLFLLISGESGRSGYRGRTGETGQPGVPGMPGPPGPQPDIQPFLNQIQQSQGGDKGPSPDPFTYMQAQVRAFFV